MSFLSFVYCLIQSNYSSMARNSDEVNNIGIRSVMFELVCLSSRPNLGTSGCKSISQSATWLNITLLCTSVYQGQIIMFCSAPEKARPPQVASSLAFLETSLPLLFRPPGELSFQFRAAQSFATAGLGQLGTGFHKLKTKKHQKCRHLPELCPFLFRSPGELPFQFRAA